MIVQMSLLVAFAGPRADITVLYRLGMAAQCDSADSIRQTANVAARPVRAADVTASTTGSKTRKSSHSKAALCQVNVGVQPSRQGHNRDSAKSSSARAGPMLCYHITR